MFLGNTVLKNIRTVMTPALVVVLESFLNKVVCSIQSVTRIFELDYCVSGIRIRGLRF